MSMPKNVEIERISIENLSDYKGHHRLSVFNEHGLKCSMEGCDVEGSHMGKWVDNGGGVHIDVFSEDEILMNVDHTIPVSMGGSNEIDNKVPMCYVCNYTKANHFNGSVPPDDFDWENKRNYTYWFTKVS